MKILRITSLLLLLLTLSAYVLPSAPLAAAQPPATDNALGQAALLRYRYLRDTELPQVLAWLHEGGPFTQPTPGLLPAGTEAAALAKQ